jgi:methylenetetrahydrofolate reductase (NADPH)
MGKALPVSLRDRLASGAFTVTAEISLPRGAATDSVTNLAGVLRGRVDAVNITDNAGASVRLASWAGSLAALAAGLEPVMQMTCRDRNRLALQSDLLGAAALGIRNVLVMTGDPPLDAKGVFDTDSTGLLTALRVMRDEGVLMSGQRLDPAPGCFLGAVENPFAPGGTARLAEKIAAGAQFVQTQFVFDIPAFVRWMKEVRDLGLHERCHILPGVGVVRSLRALDFIRDQVRGTHVPDEVYRRLRGVTEDRIAGAGERLAAETVGRLREIDGVAGVHLLAAGNELAVPPILDEAGIGARHAS